MISQRLEYAREAAKVIVDGGLTDLDESDIDAMSLADLEDFLSAWGLEWDGHGYSSVEE